ncbi:MAG TPA: cytochrome c biogenesis protein CcdA [Polyangiaceae bacterium]|nr:cytochrome c biogenesis protein CcdA [Polyangiaceae bacterium]
MRWRSVWSFGVLALACCTLLASGAAHASDGFEVSTFESILERQGAVAAVLAAFGFGVLASLTPCVYPMVPITVSIFGATRAGTRLRAAALSGTFVLGIAALFAPLGVLSALSGRLMGAALSAPWVVVALSVMFAALACSMFGAFELALPSKLVGRLASVDGFGFRGAFAMGMALGLIAAPCTGPFLTGMVALTATSRNLWLGSTSFFAFALGLGAPFFVAGALALRLPKGGAWMLGAKWLSGVALSYMAWACLRDRFVVVDELTSYSGLSFGVAAATLVLMGGLLGMLHVAAERPGSSLTGWSTRAKLASIVPAVAGCIMFVGWERAGRSPDASVPSIAWRSDEPAARARAAEAGRLVLLDFGAAWCGACGELDRKTFSDPRVQSEMQHLVAIRVDASDDSPTARNLQAKYQVVGLPTVIILDPAGREVVRFNEFITPETLVAAVRRGRLSKG